MLSSTDSGFFAAEVVADIGNHHQPPYLQSVCPTAASAQQQQKYYETKNKNEKMKKKKRHVSVICTVSGLHLGWNISFFVFKKPASEAGKFVLGELT